MPSKTSVLKWSAIEVGFRRLIHVYQLHLS